MVLSTYEKQRIIYHYRAGFRPAEIYGELRLEGITCCRQTVARFLKYYLHFGVITRKEGSGRPTKITDAVLTLVDQAMRDDDEMTAVQLHNLLSNHGENICFATILRSRQILGWTFRGSKYCQVIRNENKVKRLQWAIKYLPEIEASGFDDVIRTDESSIQLESHRRHSYRKKGEPAVLKPRPKHPIKVHVWDGITKKGLCLSIHRNTTTGPFEISCQQISKFP